MKIQKLSFLDSALFDAIICFDDTDQKTLERLNTKHGPTNFEWAFEDTYADVCVKKGRSLKDTDTRKYFINQLRKRLKYFSSEKSVDAMCEAVIYVSNAFGGNYRSEITPLLQKFLLAMKRKDFGDRKIVSEFKKIKACADQYESYWEWQCKTSALVSKLSA